MTCYILPAVFGTTSARSCGKQKIQPKKKKNDPQKPYMYQPVFAHQAGLRGKARKRIFLPPWLSCRQICRRRWCQKNTLASTWLLLSFWRERRKMRRVFASGATTRRICRTSKWWGDRSTSAHAYITRGAPICRKCATYPNFSKTPISKLCRLLISGRTVIQRSAQRMSASEKLEGSKARKK